MTAYALSLLDKSPIRLRSVSTHPDGRALAPLIGIETGSTRIAKKIMAGKALPFDIKDWPHIVLNGLEVLNRNNWFPVCTLIVGSPGETDEDSMATLDIPAIRSTQRTLQIFDRLGYPRHKVRIVVNRWSKQIELDIKTVERFLGERVVGYVQSDYNTTVNSINLGKPLVESEALRLFATLFMNIGKNAEALDLAQRALSVIGESIDREPLLARAQALNAVGNVHVHTGRLRDAVSTYAEALVIYRRLGVRRLEAATLNNMGWVFVGLGEYEEALVHYKRSLRLAQELGDRAGIGVKLANIGSSD